MSDTLLQLKGLSVSYGPVEAVHQVDLDVRSGEIVTVIGPNGAGKTTLLSAAMGLLPSRGEIHLDGKRIARPGVEVMVANGVALVPEKRELFGEMSVEDNLLLGGFSRWRRGLRDQAQRMDEVFAIFPRLRERRPQMASTLSGGERQMLAIGRALMARPRLLLLDEPSLGLAPKLVEDIFTIIARINAERGTSMLLVEQNATVALAVAHSGYIMENGKIVIDGPAERLAQDADVREFYLGMGGGGEAKSFRDLKHYKRRKRWLS